MNHKKPFDDYDNYYLDDLINRYIKNRDHRAMLYDWLINDFRFDELSDKYGYSLRHTKRIIYKESDKIFRKISLTTQ